MIKGRPDIMHRIATPSDVAQIIRWALEFQRNSIKNKDYTDDEIYVAASHYIAGGDAWESASAINCAGNQND
jgi:hypothetical protein